MCVCGGVGGGVGGGGGWGGGVFLRVNHNDVTWLGVNFDQGFPSVHHHISRSSGKRL